MGMSSGGGSGAMSEINVTPLVDVMLVLLIIFMVAAPLIEREREKEELQENRDRQQRLISMNLPVLTDAPAQTDDVKTVTLKVDANLIVSLNKKAIVDCSDKLAAKDKRAWNGCLDKVEAAAIASDTAKKVGVTIDAAPTVPWGFTVGITHRLRKAQITKVGMLPRR